MDNKRLIDAVALIDYFKEQCEIVSQDSSKESLYTLAALKCCIDFFEHFPAIDAVEVVRCKDCIFWVPEFDKIGHCDYAGIHLDHGEYGFCSYGERKQNGML